MGKYTTKAQTTTQKLTVIITSGISISGSLIIISIISNSIVTSSTSSTSSHRCAAGHGFSSQQRTSNFGSRGCGMGASRLDRGEHKGRSPAGQRCLGDRCDDLSCWTSDRGEQKGRSPAGQRCLGDRCDDLSCWTSAS